MCTAKEVKAGMVVAFDEAYTQYETPLESAFPVNPDHMVGAGDNTELMYLQDPSLLQNIRERCAAAAPAPPPPREALTGEVPDAVPATGTPAATSTRTPRSSSLPSTRTPTPGCALSSAAVRRGRRVYPPGRSYSDAKIADYAGKGIGRLPPHVYALANRAFQSMRASGKSQSMVVSGESGAGKTETCKHIMRFMAVRPRPPPSPPRPARSQLYPRRLPQPVKSSC